MGALVFDNQVFDSWLTAKSQEILSKVDREKISTEEMLVLILKAQTNHFHHMDQEFRAEFQKIDTSFNRMYDFLKWQGGILFAFFVGLYVKLFFS